MRRGILTMVIGIGLGSLAGALFGWLVPIQDFDGQISDLHPEYKAEFAIMVGAAYVENGDWDLAQARLGQLAEPDPAGYIVLLAERYIAEGRNPEDIRVLVRLASQFGYTTPPMQPYLPPPNNG